MAGEKKRVSDEIVKVIESRAKEIIEEVDHGRSEQFERESSLYRESKERVFKDKLAHVKEKNSQLEKRELARLDFENNASLKHYRNDLLEQFKRELEEEIREFWNNEGDYQKYLNDALATCDAGGTVIISARDQDLIKGYDVEIKDQKLGGFLYKVGNRIYDFTLQDRFDRAIQDFIATSQIWIRSDEQ